VRRAVAACAALAAAATAAASCDVGTPYHSPSRGPAPVLLGVDATVDVAADGTPVRADVLAATADVVTATSLTLRFDRFLLPGTSVRQSFCLRPTGPIPETPSDCTGGTFLEPTYDPVTRSITLRQEPGSRLLPATAYRLTVFAASVDVPCSTDVAACGVRAFDAAPLAASVTVEFTTLAADPPATADELLPSGDFFCGSLKCKSACDIVSPPATAACKSVCMADATCVAACVDACKDACPVTDVFSVMTGCSYQFCHAATAAIGASAQLDMQTPAKILETAIGMVAHGTQVGETAAVPEQSSARFGRSMPIVDPGFPGNSYLLYKVILGADLDPSIVASSDELLRLHSGVVVGMPMPPDFASPPPTTDGLFAIRDWILTGAPVAPCP